MKKGSIKNIIGYAISFLCLIFCIYITVEVIVANNENRPPSIFGLSVSYVPTESMEPTIEAGDYVVFSKVSFDDIKVDDIIVYKSQDNRFIIHRVIEREADYLTVKGDNNPLADSERVTSDMVYGRYIRTLGFMAIFSGGINKNLIFFILILIFIIMIIMQAVSIYIKNKTDEVKKDREDELNALRDEMRNEILKEELERLREENKKLKDKHEGE